MLSDRFLSLIALLRCLKSERRYWLTDINNVQSETFQQIISFTIAAGFSVINNNGLLELRQKPLLLITVFRILDPRFIEQLLVRAKKYAILFSAPSPRYLRLAAWAVTVRRKHHARIRFSQIEKKNP